MSFTETLAALAIAANKADKATATANDKATAHAPFALAAIMFEASMSVEKWVDAACDAANARSAKGKRNTAALRENGYGGLYNMAQALKWIEDQRENEMVFVQIEALAYMFCKVDQTGNLRRDYLIGEGIMLPAEAKLADIDTVVTAYDEAPDNDKAGHADAYWKAVGAPTSFAAFFKAAKECAKVKGDAFADKVNRTIDAIAKLDLEELKARQTELSALMAALKGASDRLESEAETVTAEPMAQAA